MLKQTSLHPEHATVSLTVSHFSVCSLNAASALLKVYYRCCVQGPCSGSVPSLSLCSWGSGPHAEMNFRSWFSMRSMLDWSVCRRSPVLTWCAFFVIWPESVRVWTKKSCVYTKKKKNWKPAGVVCVLNFFIFFPLICARCHFPFKTKKTWFFF